MIHELLQITGSHNVEGTLIIPKDTGSAQTVTGSVAQQNGEIFIFNGQNWQTLGAQSGITVPDVSLSYLVVAGGGGGGGWGGGGGAGGLLSGSIDTITSGSSFTMTVGAGSAGGQLSQTAGGYVQGVDGSNSSLAGTGYTTVTTIGGGGGGRHNSSTPDNGRDGGSGGGAGMNSGGSTGAGGSGTAGQGFDGGAGGGYSSYYYRGGGGGGASQLGQNGNGHSAGGEGGSGSLSSITGTSVRYAGGGGSHTDRRGGGGVAPGGPGGGGAGGGYQPDTHAGDGTANTGGGGGGSYGYSNSHQGGGGSGVIIVSYDSSSFSGVGGLRSHNNNKIAHIFNSSGTFNVDNSKTYLDGTLDVFGDSSCIALYQFEDNITDKSGNYNGTASGTANSYTQGYINKSVVMGGTDSNIATGIANGHTQTWAFWAYIPSGTSGDRIMMSVNSTGDGGQGFTYWAGGGGLYLYDIVGGASNTTVTISWSNTNQWRHFVWVKNGTSSIVYENGAQIGTLAAVSGNFQTGNNINIGRGTYGSTLTSLQMDNVRIFNKALSAAEVLTLFKGEE